MHNVWLIARREYLERIRTRGFLITTVMIPLIMAGFIYGSAFVGSKSRTDAKIAVVSADPKLSLDLQAEIERHNGTEPQTASKSSARRPRITVDAMSPDTADAQKTRAALDQDLDSGDLDGYLWVTSPASARPTFAFTPRSSQDESLRPIVAAAVSTVLMRRQLTHSGVVTADADSILQPIEVQAVHNPRHVDADSAGVSITVLFFLMYMVIMLYGMNVARSIIEEKTSRIFEVMLATIRPEEMMAGKIIGVGSVGLTQVAIWLTAVLALGSTFAAKVGAGNIQIGLTNAQLAYFFLFFLLGYLFYSSIAAALGAMTNSEQELQQLNMFLVMPLAVCFIALHGVLANPDGTLARTLALIPPFTPLLMYLRVSLGHPAPWEVILSVALTSASIYAIIWVTSRIYRVGVLMYGKRPNLPEIFRWLKYS